jgi:hypothetical protein
VIAAPSNRQRRSNVVTRPWPYRSRSFTVAAVRNPPRPNA